MLAVLPPLVLLLAWLSILGKPGQAGFAISRRQAFFVAAAGWGAWLALSTELLGALQQITFTGLLLAWLLPLIVLLALPATWCGMKEVWAALRSVENRRWPDKALLGGLALEALLLLAVAWMAPPNTNDAMQYHLARVMHWLQNGSLAHYPTAIDRQLWQPPWAEMAILNLMGLAASDRWANLVQWAAFVGAWVGVSGAAALLGAGRRGQLLAAWVCALLPMGILQATASQNDLVTAFWLVGVLMLVVKAHRQSTASAGGWLAGLSLPEWIGLGLLVGLGVLTKGTFAVFVLPLLAWLLLSVLRSLRAARGNSRRLAGAILLGAVLVLLLNGPHWARNMAAYASPFGPREAQTGLANQPVGAASLYSNMLRNMAQQAAMPLDVLNSAMEGIVGRLHAWVGLDVESDGFTHGAGERGFYLQYSNNNEELAGYLPHFLLGAIVLGAAFIRRKKPAWLIFAGVLCTGFLFYCLLFRWQPWGNRLILPLYVSGAALIGAWLEDRRPILRGACMALLLAGALPALFANTARPVLALQTTPEARVSVFTAGRGTLQFANSPDQYNPWISLSVELKEKAPQCSEVGYWIGSGDPEYALWTLLSPTGKERRLEYVDLSQPDAVLSYPLGEFSPCAIFSTRFDYNEDIPGYKLIASHTGSSVYVRDETDQ